MDRRLVLPSSPNRHARAHTHIPPCPPSLPLPSLCRCGSHDTLSAAPRVRLHVLALRQRQPFGNFRFADQVWSKQVRAEPGTPRSVRDGLRKPGLAPQPRLPNSEPFEPSTVVRPLVPGPYSDRDRARLCHICTGIGLTAATSAPGVSLLYLRACTLSTR